MPYFGLNLELQMNTKILFEVKTVYLLFILFLSQCTFSQEENIEKEKKPNEPWGSTSSIRELETQFRSTTSSV